MESKIKPKILARFFSKKTSSQNVGQAKPSQIKFRGYIFYFVHFKFCLTQFLVPTFTKKNPNAAQFKINSLPAGKTKQDLINQFWRTNGAFLAPKNPIKLDDQGELDALYDMGYYFPLSMQNSPFLQPQVSIVKIILKRN